MKLLWPFLLLCVKLSLVWDPQPTHKTSHNQEIHDYQTVSRIFLLTQAYSQQNYQPHRVEAPRSWALRGALQLIDGGGQFAGSLRSMSVFRSAWQCVAACCVCDQQLKRMEGSREAVCGFD
ncbi:hypothetical protein B0H13DRAFT_1857399 [Mycena leptocephala]|nr:hypothetical protein B0H13DRAFT_1857399 [Mycena leptocephala]